MRTWFQSQSSSSATIMGKEVLTPWPISGFLATIVTIPSGATDTKAESCAGAATLADVVCRARAGSGSKASSTKPPPANNDALRTVRRLRSVPASSCNMARLLFQSGGDLNRALNPVVTTTAAEVARHRGVDLFDRGASGLL